MRRTGVSTLSLVLVVLALAVPGLGVGRAPRPASRGGFDQLTQVTASTSGDPAGTLYVVEQEGQVCSSSGGTRTLFLDIRGLVACCGEQRALLGIAFDPRATARTTSSTSTTRNGNGDTRVARYRGERRAHGGERRHAAGCCLDVDQPALEPQRRPGSSSARTGGCTPGTATAAAAATPAGAPRTSAAAREAPQPEPADIGAGWRIDAYGLRNPWGYSFDRATGRSTSATSARAAGRRSTR